MSISILATPTKVRYQREGFCILFCSCKPLPAFGNARNLSVKGHVIGEPEALLNQEVEFFGEVENSQYGYTLSFTNYVINESIDYFWTNVSGATQSSLQHIFKKFGHAPDWLDKKTASFTLTTIPGIKEKTAAKILDRWKEYQGVRKLVEQLAPYGIPQKQISAIYRHFGEKAAKVLSENPYRLTEIRGIGFQKADDVARKLGVEERSPLRMSAAIVYVMQQFGVDGHTMARFTAIFDSVNENIPMSDGHPAFSDALSLKRFLDDMPSLDSKKDTRVIQVDMNGEWYALASMEYMERYIATTFSDFKKNKEGAATINPPSVIMHLTKLDSMPTFKLGDQQKNALLVAAITPNAVAIAGYAGTGKSTVSKVLLNMLESKTDMTAGEIVCCALSGVAANRIKQQSGYESFTIHSLLGFEGTGFAYNEDNKLPYSIIVLDESGMVDTWLFYSLLKAIDFTRTKLIMLGDPAQLPPVSAGQPFIDLLSRGLIKFTELTQIFRQSSDKAIPLVAQSVRQGYLPEILPSYSDVSMLKVHSEKNSDRTFVNKAIMDHVLNMSYQNRWTKALPITDEQLWDYITHFQVITPRKSGALGAEELNTAMRIRMLPSSNSPVVFKTLTPMTHFDKVIHLKNENMKINGSDDKKTRVYNGQIGVITEVNTDEQTVTVRYPLNNYSVTYEEKDLRNGLFGLAWALTIHKTQGAEFNHVVIPLTMSHFTMLNNKLFYTAITRAKSKLDLVGEGRALHYSSTNKETVQRSTVLSLYS